MSNKVLMLSLLPNPGLPNPEKNIEKKHLCHHGKNYCHFWKSNIPVINLSVDSRDMIKVSKNMSL